MSTEAVANRLVELCRQGEYEQAQTELYADDAVSIEMEGLQDGAMGNVQGLAAIREKGARWMANVVEIHGGSVSDPVVAGDWFSIAMMIDATYKDRGRAPMAEICLYQVRAGKIVREQFFYGMPGA